MRLQNARNLGGGNLLCALTGARGAAVYVFSGGATVEKAASGENRGPVRYGATIVLSGGRVTREGGKLRYESV